MLPYVINAITGVVAAGLVPDPPIVFCMNVRRVRMPVFIAEASSLFRYRSLPELCGSVNTRCRLRSSHWSRPPGRNVSPAHVAAATLFVLLWLSFLYGGYNGAMVVALTEIVPMGVRASGFSLAYALATALFGGFTPLISTWLILETGNRAAPGFWLAFGSVCSLAATMLIYRSRAS